MFFHTWPFLIFLLIVLPVFYALRKTRLWLPWLTLSSYCFYGWWNPYYLLLVLYMTAVVFGLVWLMDQCPVEEQKVNLAARLTRLEFGDRRMEIVFVGLGLATFALLGLALGGPKTLRPTLGGLGVVTLLMSCGVLCGSRKIWLLVAIANCLAPLLFFKYARFLGENGNAVLAWMHCPARLPDPSTLMPAGFEYLLPIGISFFTFQSLSYIIDFYLGTAERERSLLRLANFVCFFPQLMSGPLERAGHLLPQFRRTPTFLWQNVTDGLSLFLVGLFKKLALAGYLSLYVERFYDQPKNYGAPALILATVAYAWQIFFDFSGYTDMARGVAKLLGFHLVLNFNNPYLATGLGDFWRRWHISFSRWILDYIFMPLQLLWRDWRAWGTAAALLITFLFSGLWHGAAWTFIIWGTLHGLGLACTNQLERSAFYRKKIPKPVKQAAVFGFVCFTWIFFRAGSLEDAGWVVRRIVTGVWQDPQVPLLLVALVAAVWLYQLAYESKFREVLASSAVRVSAAVLMVLYLCLGSSGGGAFIYFQF